MKRVLVVWFPNWPLVRLLAARAELKGRPIVLYEAPPQGGLRVTACCAAAAARGIYPSMPLAEAIALGQATAEATEPLAIEPADPLADRRALEAWARWCERFSPSVGLEEAERPERLLLDVSGLAHLFGGETELARSVVRAFAEEGLAPRVVSAATIGAAWALASFAAAPANAPLVVPTADTAATLGPLPVAALRLADETIAWLCELGIERIEQLAALPRKTLLARFGEQLLWRLDQALGLAPEVILSEKMPAEFQARWLLEYPTTRPEMIDYLLARLVEEVAEKLSARRLGALRLECRLDVEAGAPLWLGIGLYRPSAIARHLLDLVRLRLERARPGGPVSGIEIAATVVGPCEWEQQQLFAEESPRGSPRQLATLVDRLGTRLGREAVVRPVLLEEAQPEHACQYLPWADSASPRRKSAARRTKAKESFFRSRPLGPGERPTLVHPRPLPLAVSVQLAGGPPGQFRLAGREHRVAAAWGPERIETAWWRGGYVRRDYYRVETTAGSRYWLFKELRTGQWFLQGEFA